MWWEIVKTSKNESLNRLQPVRRRTPLLKEHE